MRTVADGDLFVDRKTSVRIPVWKSTLRQGRNLELTDNERRVLDMMTNGLRSRQICEETGWSAHKVQYIRNRIRGKLRIAGGDRHARNAVDNNNDTANMDADQEGARAEKRRRVECGKRDRIAPSTDCGRIGEAIKAARLGQGFTQAVLAGKLGISIPYVSRIESGDLGVPARIEGLIRKVLGIDIGALRSKSNGGSHG